VEQFEMGVFNPKVFSRYLDDFRANFMVPENQTVPNLFLVDFLTILSWERGTRKQQNLSEEFLEIRGFLTAVRFFAIKRILENFMFFENQTVLNLFWLIFFTTLGWGKGTRK
jgi:hypothetical protein